MRTQPLKSRLVLYSAATLAVCLLAWVGRDLIPRGGWGESASPEMAAPIGKLSARSARFRWQQFLADSRTIAHVISYLRLPETVSTAGPAVSPAAGPTSRHKTVSGPGLHDPRPTLRPANLLDIANQSALAALRGGASNSPALAGPAAKSEKIAEAAERESGVPAPVPQG